MNTSFRGGLQFAWDSTSIKYAEDCLYKYKLKMIDGWQPRYKSVHLEFGGWYASALERYYKHTAAGVDRDEALRRIVREALVSTWKYEKCPACEGRGYVESLIKQHGEYEHNEDQCRACNGTGQVFDDEGNAIGAPWVSDHNAKTRENLIRTIIWYVDHFAEDPVAIHVTSDGKPALEYSFSFEVDNGIVLSGHIDRLVEYSGAYYVMDQKTTGSTISSQYFDSYDPDTQMSLYTMAGQIIYKQKVKGVIIDAAQIAVGFSRFMRGFTFRDDAKLEEWYKSAMYTIGQARSATEAEYFPMNPSSCHKYTGCDFRRICSRSPHVREQFLKADFVQGPKWDPLKRR